MKRKLSAILRGLPGAKASGDTGLVVTGVSCNTAALRQGNIFVAIPGYKRDGNDFIPAAVKNGASAIVTSVPGAKAVPSGVPLVIVDDSRHALAVLSSAFFNEPSLKLDITGITGTNGKTTVSYLIEAILRQNRKRVAVLGTIGYRIGSKTIPADNTTPQSSDLQSMLYQAVKEKIDSVVMEVSSHALAQERVGCIEFDAAVFTNLTRDHLDFHKDMDDYLNAKARLFEGLGKNQRKKGPKIAVINADDPYSGRILERTPVKAVTYGINSNADIGASEVNMDVHGVSFVLEDRINCKKERLFFQLSGMHNVSNVLAATAYAIARGIALGTVRKGIEKVKSVPGRFEVINGNRPFTVIVDYAHTDDSLRRTIIACRELAPRRIITVFGCGGDRDRGKRPLMGQAAVTLSDYSIITSDNPRSEDPEKISLDVETGIKKLGMDNYEVMNDREKAIARAVNMASRGDIVLIAGKGHEEYQITGNKKEHFSDRETAEKYLERIKKNGKNGNS